MNTSNTTTERFLDTDGCYPELYNGCILILVFLFGTNVISYGSISNIWRCPVPSHHPPQRFLLGHGSHNCSSGNRVPHWATSLVLLVMWPCKAKCSETVYTGIAQLELALWTWPLHRYREISSWWNRLIPIPFLPAWLKSKQVSPMP